MTLLASMLMALTGFVLLALAMQRHQRDLLQRRLSPARARGLRFAGGIALLASFAPMGLGWGIGVGVVLWIALLSFAALPVILIMTARVARAGTTR